MSISEKQRQTSRVNGAKSRGPLTPRGKTISSQNALRHGMLANTIVLEGESTERFTALLQALHKELDPRTEIEIALIENMAACRWRQMRLWGIEKAGLSHEIHKQDAANSENPGNDAATQAALAFRALCDDSRSLDMVNRYEIRFDRQYNRSLQRLSEIRRQRAEAPTAA